MSNSMHPAVRDLLNIVREHGAAEGGWGYMANIAGYTLISGSDQGSFANRGGLVPLGTACHVLLQTAPDGDPMLRTYVNKFARIPTESLLGGATHNQTAHDLTGKRGREFEARNVGLANAASRLITGMFAGENTTTPADLALPYVYVAFPVAALRKPIEGPALRELAKAIQANRHSPRTMFAPVTGRVIAVDVLANGGNYGEVSIQAEDGHIEKVLVCLKGEKLFGVNGIVSAGTPLMRFGAHLRWELAVEIAWWEVLGDAPEFNQPGVSEPLAWLPLTVAAPAIERGAKAAGAVEDIRHLLGVPVENPAAESRLLTQLMGPSDQMSPPDLTRLLTTMRARLGHLSRYATDADVLAAIDSPENPLTLSGMAKCQFWAVSSESDLRIRRPGLLADFAGLRSTWRGEFPSPNPMAQPLTAVAEARILDAAVEAAQNATHPGEAAAAAIAAATTTMSTTVSTLRLLDRSSAPNGVQEYLEHARAETGAAAPELQAAAD